MSRLLTTIKKATAVFSCLVLFSACTKSEPERAELSSSTFEAANPLESIIFLDDGSIRVWNIQLDDGRMIPLLHDRQNRFLALHVQRAGEDITNEIEWHDRETMANRSVRFVGHHEESGLSVVRLYSWNVQKGAVRVSIAFSLPNATDLQRYDGRLALSDGLNQHISGDGLGDYLYGYQKVFYVEPDDSYKLFRKTESMSTGRVAFVTRHIALLTQQDIQQTFPTINLVDESPVTAHLPVTPDTGRTPPGPQHFQFVYELVALPLMSSNNDELNTASLLLYKELWAPLRSLARLIERALLELQSMIGSLGVAVIVLVAIVRVLLLPLTLWSFRQHESFTLAQQRMAPKVEQIKATLKGAERSEEMLALYKEHHVSPFSGLKGSIALFVQLPILIAFFSITTESALFRDIPFLWIADLSLPDRFVSLPFDIPILGGFLNLLPIALALISSAASAIHQRHALASTAGNTRTAMLIVSLIVVLFYSCASALVLYWCATNVFQIFEKHFARRIEETTRGSQAAC